MSRIGPHAGNRPLDSEARELLRREIQACGAGVVKLMWPEHNRIDATFFGAMGLQVIVRAPGEGVPHVSDVRAMITEFAGVCDWIEAGNEPYPTELYPDWQLALWVNAWHLEAIWNSCADLAHAAGIRLCTPGWHGNDEPFQPRGDNGALITLPPALVERLRSVYGLYDGIGAHAYGLYNLEELQLRRLERWAGVYPDKPLLLTEVGIAANDVIGVPPDPARYDKSRLIKGQRLGVFAARFFDRIPQAECFVVFISDGSTPEWGSFAPGGAYKPDGPLGYWLGLPGWHAFGRAFRERRAA